MNNAFIVALSLLFCLPACCKKQQCIAPKTESQEVAAQGNQVPADDAVKSQTKF